MRRNTALASTIFGVALGAAMTMGTTSSCSGVSSTTAAKTVKVGGFVDCTDNAPIDSVYVTPNSGPAGNATLAKDSASNIMGTTWTYSKGTSNKYTIKVSCGNSTGTTPTLNNNTSNDHNVTCQYQVSKPTKLVCDPYRPGTRG